jgi:site-specific DNA recombinase
MLRDAKAGAFRLLVLRDESRLGGDVNRTGLVIQDLTDAKIKLVYYYSDEIVNVEGAVNKLLISVRNFASEYEREKISQRTYEHLLKKAKSGKPAGGIAYGYAIEAGVYVVHEPHAATVRRIFELYAGGKGQRSIAHILNAEGIASPRAGKRGTGSWAPSAIRSMLTNPRYIGQGRYNQRQKLYRSGTRVREWRPNAEHVLYDTPPIIDSQLWSAVTERFEANAGFGKAKPRTGAPSKHLLVGLSRCAMCGGPMSVRGRKIGQLNAPHYVCSYQHDRGETVCKNTVRRPVVTIDSAVIDAIKAALTADVLADLAANLRADFQERLATAPAQTEALTAEAGQLRRERARFIKLVASTDDPPVSIVQEITARDKRLREVELQLASMEASLSTTKNHLDDMERELLKRLEALQEQFAEGPVETRAALVALLGGSKLQLTPENGKFRIRGKLALSLPYCVASPAGFNTVWNEDKPAESLSLDLAA